MGQDIFGARVEALGLEIARLQDEPALEEQAVLLLQQLETAHEELRVAQEELSTQHLEMERLLHAQQAHRSRFERVVSLVPAVVVLTDDQGIVRMGNAAASAILGGRRDLLLNKPIFTFFDPAERSALRRLLVTTLRDGSTEAHTTGALVSRQGRLEVEVAISVERAVDDRREVTWVMVRRPESRAATGAPAVARALSALTRIPLGATSSIAVLSDVAAVCEQALDIPVWVSMSVGEPVNPQAVATHSVIAQRVDGAQVTAGEGPCQAAWKLDRVVVVKDLTTDHRWPRMRQRLTEMRATAVVAAPIRDPGGRLLGVLNVYGATANLVAPDNVEAVTLLADAVAAVFAEVETKSELQLVADQLREALTSRATIDQAKGIVMALRHCTQEEAFQVLVKASNDANVKLRDLAADLVSRAPLGVSS